MENANRQLAVEADLVIRHEHGDMLVTGSGDRLRVEVPGWSMGRWAYREMRRQASIDGSLRMDHALKSCGLGVEVALAGRVVGRLGKGAHPGLLDRALGLPPLQINYGDLLRAVVSRGTR